MGTPDFARDSLEAVYNAGYEILGVVTNPDKPKGRGMKMVASPVKEFALEKGLTVYQPEKVRNNESRRHRYDICPATYLLNQIPLTITSINGSDEYPVSPVLSYFPVRG